MHEMRVQANGIEMQIRDYQHEGEAVVFLHFSGANLMMWARVIPYFQDRYRLVLVDLRGHGKSDVPETGYHMDDMACDIVGIMQHLDLERAHIVGSSLGAEVGLSLAANYPHKLISLVCDGALSSEYGPYGTWEGSLEEYEEHVSHQLEKMRNAPETIYSSIDALVDARRELFKKYIGWNEYIEALERYGANRIEEGKFTKGFGKPAMVDYMSHYFQYRFEDYYRKVQCPILMLPGEDVMQDEREMATMQGLSELAQQVEIVAVKGWDHPYGWLLDPEGVSEAILKFLSEIAHKNIKEGME